MTATALAFKEATIPDDQIRRMKKRADVRAMEARIIKRGPGYGGEPQEMEPIARRLLKAKPGEPGHDDAINPDTRRKKWRSRFERYGYKRLSAEQINAFEWFANLCEVVSAGTLSQSRYGKEMGSVAGVSYANSREETRKFEYALQCATLRRKCISRINGVKADPNDDAAAQDQWRALKWAVEDDITPREIGERLIARRAGYPVSSDRQTAGQEAIAIGMVALTDAIEVLIKVSNGR